jgi:hypothetical protein
MIFFFLLKEKEQQICQCKHTAADILYRDKSRSYLKEKETFLNSRGSDEKERSQLERAILQSHCHRGETSAAMTRIGQGFRLATLKETKNGKVLIMFAQCNTK